mgnify:CR=1 FL=1
MQYIDYKNVLGKYELKEPEGIDVSKEITKPVLVVSHELSRTGAPIVLFDLVQILKKNGYDVFVVSYEDGELKENYLKIGMTVTICEKRIDNEWLTQLSRLFDMWIINTLVMAPLVNYMRNKRVNIVWWLHESEYFFIAEQSWCKKICPTRYLQIVAAGPYVHRMVQKYFGIDVPILNFGVRDVRISHKEIAGGKVKFIHVGTIEKNKGQVILADAIEKLSYEYLKRAEFIFVGKIETADNLVLKKLYTLRENSNNVKVIDAMEQNELYKLYDYIDCIVVSSIKEATSAIAVEGLMKEKICICSDTCGVVNYLKDKESALIFPCGDSVALAEKIKYVIDNRCCLENIRKNGRMVYEKIYSMEALERGWNNIVQKFNSEYIEKYTIDVVIYNYNSTEYILQTLDSIDQVFYSNMNIIVVDDASENNCLSVLENRYADRNNVMYIQNDEHMGMYETFRTAYSVGNGQFYAFITAGTTIDANHFNVLINTLDYDDKLAAAFSSAYVYDRISNWSIIPYDDAEKYKTVERYYIMDLLEKYFSIEAGLFRKSKSIEFPNIGGVYGKFAFREFMIDICGRYDVGFNGCSIINTIRGLISNQEYVISDKEEQLYDILVMTQHDELLDKNNMEYEYFMQKKLEYMGN